MSVQTQNDKIVIMTFDIGEKNFTCFKDSVSLEKLKSIKDRNIPLCNRYDKNGECTSEFSTLLRTISSFGRRVFVDKVDLTKNDDKKFGKRRVITNRLLVRLTNYLEDLNQQKIFDDVSYFLIEDQLKSADNNRQIQFHLRSYLLLLFLNFKPIIAFPSSYKTKVLGAPKKVLDEKSKKIIKMTKPIRKKWASERAFSILSDRNDLEGIDVIYSKKKTGKSDDIADCILMSVTFQYLLFIDDRVDILDS